MLKRVVLGGLMIAAIAACGGADETITGLQLPGGDGGSGGAGGDVTPEPSDGGSGPAVCPDATGVYQVEPADSNLLFLVDRSGSMHLDLPDGGTRWTETKAGLFSIYDALPSYTYSGVTMFPSGDQPITCCEITADNIITCPNCADGELPEPETRCNADTYHNLGVPMASVDALQLEKMKAHVSTVDDEFYWGTPLAPALQGAIESLDSVPDGVSSVVLLTDGKPTSCHTADDPEANDILRAVDAAQAGNDQAIRTYVLGVIDGDKAADATNLSAVAVAGGTARYAGCEDNDDCGWAINVDNFASELGAALESIALEAISCTFDVPNVDGGAPDYDAVNITITSDGTTTTIPRDTSHGNGWDYLSGDAQVQLYGAACEQLKQDGSASVEIVVGCQTVEG